MIVLLVILVIAGWLLVQRPLREHNVVMEPSVTSGGGGSVAADAPSLSPSLTGVTETDATGTTGTTESTGATGATESTGQGAGVPAQDRIDLGQGERPVPRALSSLGRYESPYTPAHTRTIVDLSPIAKSTVTQGYSGVIPPDGTTKDQIVARFLTMIVARFYDSVYKVLTVPVTPDTVSDYIDTTYASSSRTNRTAYKDLLQRYFIHSGSVERTDQTFSQLDANTDDMLDRGEFRQVTPAQVVGLGGGEEDTLAGDTQPLGEFERALREYRSASTNYRLTGNQSFKTQADGWQRWIDQQIGDIRTAVTDNTTYIRDFIQKYESSDADLQTLQGTLHSIRQTGPQIQAQYETEREAQKQDPLDFTPFYWKAQLAAGLLVGALGVSFFV